MNYSDIEIYRLAEGKYTVGLDKVFVPHNPNTPLPKGTLFIAVNPFVIKTPREVILLDCGLGEEAQGRTISFLTENLAQLGIEREAVTKVIFSHLHADHIGGAIFQVNDTFFPTFPNATYYAQSDEIATLYTGRSASLREQVIETLEDYGQLERLRGNGWIDDMIEVRLTGGHTPFHQAILLHSQGRTVFYGGDVLPQPAQINRKFQAKYDFAPEVSQIARQEIAKEAFENGYLLLFYHSTQEPACFITDYDARKGYRLELLSLEKVSTL